MGLMLGKKIEVPKYTKDQAEIWVDRECPSYTGIMAAINGIAFKKFGCFIDELNETDEKFCLDNAAKIGLAWFEMLEIEDM